MSSGTTWSRPRSTARARRPAEREGGPRAGPVLDHPGQIGRQVVPGFAGDGDEPAGVLDQCAVQIHRAHDVLGAMHVVDGDDRGGTVAPVIGAGVHPAAAISTSSSIDG